MKPEIQKAALQSVSINSSFLVKPAKPQNLMTEREICAYLNVSKRNLYCWRMAGLIPYIKIGRAVRFRPEDVEDALERMTVQRERTRE